MLLHVACCVFAPFKLNVCVKVYRDWLNKFKKGPLYLNTDQRYISTNKFRYVSWGNDKIWKSSTHAKLRLDFP